MTLWCNATGVPKPNITWQKDNVDINASADSRISISQDGAQLNITNLSRTDTGEYKCVANNSEGSNTSKPATLTVECMETIIFLVIVTNNVLITIRNVWESRLFITLKEEVQNRDSIPSNKCVF